jgi:hypothetical protein
MTLQDGGNASTARNDVLLGTIAKDRFVSEQAPASTRINSEYVSNEIDESELQCERQYEERI